MTGESARQLILDMVADLDDQGAIDLYCQLGGTDQTAVQELVAIEPDKLFFRLLSALRACPKSTFCDIVAIFSGHCVYNKREGVYHVPAEW